MRLVSGWILLAVMAMLAFVAAVVKKAAEVAIEKEYPTWAPRLAHGLVSVAAFVCRSRGAQWRADLDYVQKVEDETGLVEATSCFVSCWYLALASACTRVRLVWGERTVLHESLNALAAVVGSVAATVGALQAWVEAGGQFVVVLATAIPMLMNASTLSIHLRLQRETRCS